MKFGAVTTSNSTSSPDFEMLRFLPADQKILQIKTGFSNRTVRYKLAKLKSAGLLREVTDLKDARHKLCIRGDGRSAMRPTADR